MHKQEVDRYNWKVKFSSVWQDLCSILGLTDLIGKIISYTKKAVLGLIQQSTARRSASQINNDQLAS
jgi:hypothetical protein